MDVNAVSECGSDVDYGCQRSDVGVIFYGCQRSDVGVIFMDVNAVWMSTQ